MKTIFLRLLANQYKETDLKQACISVRTGVINKHIYQVDIKEFSNIPGKPFAYWVSDNVRSSFTKFPGLHRDTIELRVGVQTSDDFRFLRLGWEINDLSVEKKWMPLAKGGGYSPFYGDISLRVLVEDNFSQIVAYTNGKYPYLNGNARSFMHADMRHFSQPGFTWTYRPSNTGSFRALPAGSIFGVNGSSGFDINNDFRKLLGLLSILNSAAYNSLIKLLFARGGEGSGQTLTYEVGYVGDTPIPNISEVVMDNLSSVALESWAIQRSIDSIIETSNCFLGPQKQLASYLKVDIIAAKRKILDLQSIIDKMVFDIYEFSESDKLIAISSINTNTSSDENSTQEENDDCGSKDQDWASLSWMVGVAFGRFNVEIKIPSNWNQISISDPFKKIPSKSPNMLLDSVEVFHKFNGILVDDKENHHDLANLIEKINSIHLDENTVDVRKWLRDDFFKYHLGTYSKSRRKAPIYWPLSTKSGLYTLWLYYPNLSNQTLYTAINDFIEPKLKGVESDVTVLRNKGAGRLRDEEKQFEHLQAFELELIELRDTLLQLAPSYQPNHNDGVQISAAPLWSLFRYKPWHKVLKETWAKLEKGEYDWSYLAMSYWPDRVQKKCKTDKSLAIAHGLEHLYVEPLAQLKKTGKKKKTVGDE